MSVILSDKYPVHKAAREGRLEDLKSLLNSGAYDVNKGTFELVRPIHEACLAGHYDCVKLLLLHGASVNLANIDGATALCDACSNGNVDCVQLLLDHGAVVNPPFLMTTPVHEAVFRDNWQCILLLLSYGACLDKSDCHFGTPLHIAACKGHKTSAAVLLRAGASPNVSKIHQTPLHDAARGQDLDFIELLLEHGADVYARNGRGWTARQLVPSSTSPCKVLLLEWEREPRSLRFVCRQSIRSAVGPSRFRFLSQLPLPKLLIGYLNHE